MVSHQEYSSREYKAQQWRRLTPLAVVTNLLTTFCGIGLAVYFGNYYVTSQDKKFELNDQRTEMILTAMKEDRNKFWSKLDSQDRQIDCIKTIASSALGDKAHFEKC